MDMEKNTKIVTVILIVLFFLPVVGVPAAGFDNWHTYTSTNQVRYIDYFDDSLQVVTSGGWLKIDPLTLGMTKITNDKGIGTNDLNYILKDASSSIWLAGYGRLIKSADNQYIPYLFFDRNNSLLTLYSLADDNDNLWVGSSTGLALFSKTIDGGQIQDLYFRFGDFDPEPAVYDLLLRGDSIWIATSEGLAVSDKSNPDLLKSFINWKTFSTTVYPELRVDTIKALAYYRGALYLGTTRNAFYLSVSGADTSFVKLVTREPFSVKHMIVQGDSLFIYGSNGYYIQTAAGLENHAAYSDYFCAGRIVAGVLWAGTQARGLWYGTGPNLTNFNDEGLPGNIISSLSSSRQGQVAACFRRDGAAILDTTGWNKLNIFVSDWATSTTQDNSGNLWVGTWGNGLFKIKDDTIVHYNQNNSSLRGVLEGPHYVVVNSLVSTPRYIFMTNYRALDGNPVSAVDLNHLDNWVSFGAAEGISTDRLISIDCSSNTLALGTENNGVFLYYFGPDPFDKSDDSAVNYREDNSWLGSNNVNVVSFDNHGVLWVGTKFGLSRYDPGIERFINVQLPGGFGPEVTRLIFDRRGNAWMGAHNGLARYDAVSGDFEVFTTLNSGLSDIEISALMINSFTNDLWIGTSEGISVLESPIGPPTSDIARVIAFPNPFIIRGADEVLSFNYNGDAIVRLYTAAGELVREMSVNVNWDGTNQHGQKVAPGVYLFLITAPDGSVGRGKILLIRK